MMVPPAIACYWMKSSCSQVRVRADDLRWSCPPKSFAKFEFSPHRAKRKFYTGFFVGTSSDDASDLVAHTHPRRKRAVIM